MPIRSNILVSLSYASMISVRSSLRDLRVNPRDVGTASPVAHVDYGISRHFEPRNLSVEPKKHYRIHPSPNYHALQVIHLGMHEEILLHHHPNRNRCSVKHAHMWAQPPCRTQSQ